MATDNTHEFFYELKPSPRAASQLEQQARALEKNLRFKGPFGVATRETKDFASELDRANQRVITLGASFAVLATGIKTMKDIVRSTIEVEKAFTEINAVFGLSAKGLDTFSKQLFSTARDTAQSFDKAANAAKEFSRQGLTAAETIQRTRDALMLTRLANLDVAKSVETLTASINGFQKSALTSSEIVNKLATVDAKFAVSSADLAEALSRSGAAASDAGVSFDQLIGLVTSAQQTTARGGAVIGNALKTIFTRIERGDTIEAFRALGVEVEDASGAMLGAIPLLQNFATTYDGLNGALKKNAAELVGGVYQINILKSLLGDVAKVNGAFAQATATSANATDEATKRNEALNQSLDSMLTKLGVTAKQIGSNIGGQSFAGPLKTLLSSVQNNPITAALEDASGKAETIGGKIAQELLQGIGGTLVYGLGPLLAAALGKVVLSTGKSVFKDFGDLTQLTTKGQDQARVQSEIVGLYRAGGVALQQQLAAMTSITDKAALLQRLLATSAVNPNSASAMAAAVVGQGYRGRGMPRAAEGYVPMAEEAAMIARGVGGAPASAKPVYLPGFNRGGGQRGIVANTSEFIVPGAAGGAIFNQEMIQRYGLPPGAKPVAAGGYIPNAAGGFNPGAEVTLRSSSGNLTKATIIGITSASTTRGKGEGYQLRLPSGAMTTIFESQLASDPGRMTLGAAQSRSGSGGGKPSVMTSGAGGGGKLPPVTPVASAASPLGPDPSGRYQPDALRMRAGTVGNLGGGFHLQPAQLKALNDLFASLSKAGTLAEAFKVGPQIVDMANSLDKLSQKRVLKDLAVQIDKIAVSSRIPAAIAAGAASPHREYSPNASPWGVSGPTVAESRANGGHADDYNDYLSRRDKLAAPGMRERQRAIRATEPPTPSFMQRWKGRLNSPQAGAYGAAFGLPFLGGMVDEGKGGTAEGMGRGALGSGLTAAGAGASFGLMFGPMGAGIGAGVGGILGGAYGALRKIEQSFEELATQINETNAKIQRQVEFVQSAYRLQGDIVNILQDTSLTEGQKEAKLKSRRQARTQAILSVKDPKIQAELKARLNDPNGLKDITDLLTEDQRRTSMATDIQSATRRALDTGRTTRGLFGYSKEAPEEMSKTLLPAIQELSATDRERVSRLLNTNPGGAFSLIASSAGMKEKDIGGLIERTGSLMGGAGNTQNLFQRAIQMALDDLANSGIIEIEEKSKSAEAAAAKFAKTLQQLSSEYRLQGSLAQVSLNALRTVTAVRDQLDLQSPGLLDVERLGLQGRQERQQIVIQSQSQRNASLLNGRSSLIDILTQSGAQGADSEAFRERIKGLSSLGALEKLQSDVSTPGGARGLPGVASQDFKDKLSELIGEIRILNATEEQQTQAVKQATDIQIMQIQRTRTRYGAGLEYAGTSRNAGYDLTGALSRNDVPGVVQSAIVTSSLADLDRRFQGGTGRSVRRDPGLLSVYEDDANADPRFRTLSPLRRGGMSFSDYTFQAGRMGTSLSGLPRMGRGQYEGEALGIKINDADAQATSQAAAVRYLMANPQARGSKGLSGDQVTSGLLGEAGVKGRGGDAQGSFLGGFRAVIDGAKRDLMDFSRIGAQVAESLHGGLTDFWTNWATGAMKGKDAFKGFVSSVLNDVSRMLASKAFTAALSAIPGFSGFGAASGGRLGFAAGGMVPAMLTGGEYVVGPKAAKQIGYDTLRRLNGYADGGMVRGGSGVKDDVPANLPSGSFVIRKSAVQKLGPGYLNALAAGQVQHRWLGGALMGAAIGGGLGYLTGGKKGAIGGALVGGIAGGLYSHTSGATAGAAQGNYAATLSLGSKAALGLAAAGGLGLLAGGIMAPKKEKGPIGLSEVNAFRMGHEAYEADQMAKDRKRGEHAFLSINPQGGYSLAGFEPAPATRRWNSGGAVDAPLATPMLRFNEGGIASTPMAPMPTFSMDSGGSTGGGVQQQVSVKIEINNNGQVSSSSEGSGGIGTDGAGRLEKLVRGWVRDEQVQSFRSDGFMTQRSRYLNA